MRTIGIAECIGSRRGNHRNVDVDFAVLNRLPAPAVRAQYAHAAHLALGAVVAQRAVHAAFNVMDDTGLHKFDRGFLRGEGGARKPHQIFDADSGCGFERHERDPIAIAQMMMIRDHHTVAQAAAAQSGFEIGHALVAVLGIIFARANGWGSLSSARLIFRDTQERNLRLAVDHGGHAASGGVLREFDAFRHCALPIAFALATSLRARSTTGGSIIFDPRLTTPSPRCCASSKAATIFSAFSISTCEGAKAS